MLKGDKIQSEILIADDNPENLNLLSRVLKKEGYKVRIAKNGRQVLESIKASEPDLLLLDVNMPEMNGFEVCKIIKQEWGNELLPVVFLTALSDTFNKVQAFEAGGVDYIVKPFEIEEIKIRVKTHLRIRHLQTEVEDLKKRLE